MTAHAKLSPSGAHRWMECPGSIRMSEGYTRTSSVFADEGTAAHTLAEFCLTHAVEPADFYGGWVDINTGKILWGDWGHLNGLFNVDDEMVDAVTLYVETVRSLIEPGDEVEYEAKLDLSHIPGMEFGTGDTVIFKPAKQRIVVVDLKYGRGVAVEAVDNPQTLTYALGVAKRYHNRGVDEVECVIVQPRCPHPAGPVRRQVIDGLSLVEFRMDLAEAAERALAPDAPLNPGEWCRFCPAAADCPALRDRALAVAAIEFGSDDTPPEVGKLTPDYIATVLRSATIVEDWIKRVKERAHQMAMDGAPPTGFKLVASRATRRWRDEEEAAGYMAAVLDLSPDDIYVEPKMKSPAGIEKVIGEKRKGEIADLVISKSSGTILVPLEDPRPPAKADATEEFAE